MLSATVHGEGRPLVLLPGFALDATVMSAAFEPALAVVPGWRRIYLDLPGTGGSAPGEPTSDAVLAAVRSSVVQLAGDAPFGLVGHSYGGYLAAGYARRWPERVAGLLLVCSAPRIRPQDRDLGGLLPSSPEAGWLDGVPAGLHEHLAQAVGHQTRVVADRLAATLAGRGPLDQAYLDALRPDGYRLTDEPPGPGPVPGTDPGAAPGPEPAAGPAPGMPSGRSAREVESGRPAPEVESGRPAPEVEFGGPAPEAPFGGPVAMLAGRRDRIAGYRDSLAAFAAYPHGNATLLADAGHYLPFEQPGSLAALTLDWLAALA